MRLLLFFAVFFIQFKSFGQFKESDYHCRRDSLISQTKYGSVYITRDHSCDLYNWLCPDPKSWMNSYEIDVNFPEIAHFLNPKQSIGNFPRYWNNLYAYHGNYYVYGPSDWMANRPDFLSDSFLVEIASDITYFRIKKTEVIRSSELLLTVDLYGEEAKLRIRMLVFPEGASLWEYAIKNESWSELKVSSDFIRNYDMINNDCVHQKCFQEFQFDPIDISRLKFRD
jgi:hypothetical protein